MAIGAGLLISTMTALVVSASDAELWTFHAIELPVSGDHDEFEYHNSGLEELVAQDESVKTYDWSSRFAARFVGQKTLPDRTGISHDAIEFLYLRLGDWREDDGILVHPDGSTRGARGLLDLTTKTYLAHDKGSYTSYDWTGSRDTAFRPLVRWQGLRIEPGMTLASDPFLAYRYGNLSGHGRPQTADEECMADRTGFLGDTPVVGIRCIMVIKVFADDGSLASKQRWEETSWVADGHAYPLRVDYAWSLWGPERSARGQSRDVLVRLEKGGEPVAWDSCDDLDHFPYYRADLERTKGPSPPWSGGDPVLAYPLDQAMAAVARDPKLHDWHAWRADHQETHLLTASYVRLEQGDWAGGAGAHAKSYRWQFVHWADDDTAFRVETMLSANGQVLNRDGACGAVRALPSSPLNATCWLAAGLGEFRLPLPLDGQPPYPENPITIAAAHKLAASVVRPDVHEQGISGFRWGPKTIVGLRGDGYNGYNASNFNAFLFDDVELQYDDELHASSSTSPAPGGWSVGVDVGRGVLLSVSESAFTPGEALEILDAEDPPSGGVVDYSAPPNGAPLRSVLVPAVAAGGVVALLVSLFLFLLPRLRDVLAAGLAWMPGYAKLRRHEVLHQPVRHRIYETIRGQPGLNATQIHAVVGGGWSTVIFHLRKLSGERLVSVVRDGRHRRFFLAGTKSPADMAKLSTLRNSATRSTYDHLRERPGVSRTDLARQMNMTVPGVLWHLNRLEESGLVVRRTDGRTIRYEPMSGA